MQFYTKMMLRYKQRTAYTNQQHQFAMF